VPRRKCISSIASCSAIGSSSGLKASTSQFGLPFQLGFVLQSLLLPARSVARLSMPRQCLDSAEFCICGELRGCFYRSIKINDLTKLIDADIR